jgi:hypothetical protein
MTIFLIITNLLHCIVGGARRNDPQMGWDRRCRLFEIAVAEGGLRKCAGVWRGIDAKLACKNGYASQNRVLVRASTGDT